MQQLRVLIDLTEVSPMDAGRILAELGAWMASDDGYLPTAKALYTEAGRRCGTAEFVEGEAI